MMAEDLHTSLEISDGSHTETVTVTAIKGSGIAGTVVAQGLYTYYKFDDNFEDATENGIDGFGTASPAFVHPTLTDGNWHHIALVSDFETTTYSTITTTLYVDGQEVYTLTEDANHFSENGGSQSSYDTGTSFTMGGSLQLNKSMTLTGTNMSVDNFRVYDTRRLSASEIQEIYNAKQ